jgi:hypothetical protein
MAREAGGRAQQNKNCDVEYVMSAESLQRLVEIVRADEREACALICNELRGTDMKPAWDTAAAHCAAAIRARGQA